MSATGYVRQSASSITSGKVVASAPVNNEFNQIVAAFSGTSGHDHSGGTGLGPTLTSAAFGISTATAGIVAATGVSGAFTNVTITGTANQITVTNGSGAAGNPTLSLASALVSGSFTPTSVTVPANGLYLPSANTPGISANSLPVAVFVPTSSAVNYLGFTGGATGSSVTIGALGSDGNISIQLVPQGTGVVQIPVGTSSLPSLSIGETGTGLFRPSAGQIGMSLSGSEIYIFTATGLGIGKTPTAALDISGGLKVSANVTLSGSGNSVGTITSGNWQGSVITGTFGGTGVNNGSNTITLANNLTTSGNFALTLTTTGVTSVTLPTSGTLAVLASPAFTGVPTAPTAANGVNTTQIATTAYVQANISTLGGGTVTQVATNNGLTGGTITTTGTIGLATIANARIMANVSGVSAVPTANTLSAIIDTCLDNTQGDILYRNATNWVALSAGTSGQVLQTGGAGANPSWTTALNSIITLPAAVAIPTGATGVTQAVNNSSTKIATTAFCNPANSLGANGWLELPSGVIIQWGSTAPGTVNFPTTFPTAVWSVVTGTQASTTNRVVVHLTSVGTGSFNGVTRFADGSAGSEAFYWMAIGN